MPGQGRLGDKANAPVDAHGCPACPHPAIGPGISGSTNVFVNQRPALRVTDRGIHAACCAANTWVAQTGSATVFINGKPAHRIGDVTTHCGGIGRLVEGSSDVLVGDSASAGLPLPSIRSLAVPKMVLPGVPFELKLGALKLPPFVTRVDAAVVWTVDGVVCPARGDGITIRLGPRHAGRNIVIAAHFGMGSPPFRTVVAVPQLTLEGPDTVEIDEEIQLRARVEPGVPGRYRWFDAAGKLLGEGEQVLFVGRKKSKKPGDQPVECRFTSKDGAVVLTERHPITVVKVPRLRLPIKVSLPSLGETVRWLRDNPMEVRIDGAVVGSHAMVEGAGRIVVSFRATAGEHAVIVSSGASNWAAGRSPIRIVHFSAKVQVTEDDSVE